MSLAETLAVETFADLNKLVAKRQELNKRRLAYEKEHSDEPQKLKDMVKELDTMIHQTLEQHDLQSYSAPEGTATLKVMTTTIIPKVTEDKKAFIDYFLEHSPRESREEAFMDLLGLLKFDAVKLREYVQDQVNQREDEGNFDTSFPGLEEPGEFTKLSVTKGR